MLCLYAKQRTCGSIHWRQSQSMPQKWEDETVSVVVHIWHCFQEVPWVKLLASRKKKLLASIRELWQGEPERRDATFLVCEFLNDVVGWCAGWLVRLQYSWLYYVVIIGYTTISSMIIKNFCCIPKANYLFFERSDPQILSSSARE